MDPPTQHLFCSVASIPLLSIYSPDLHLFPQFAAVPLTTQHTGLPRPQYAISTTTWSMVLRAYYAMSGTDVAYGATRVLCGVWGYQEIEKVHVHELYDAIAPHFSAT
eukprot:2528390-Rhodomonas_salina.1